MGLRFEKWEALGNDFILLDERAHSGAELHPLHPPFVEALLDRRFGVGADQLLRLRSSASADAAVDFYNSDGSMAEMCGNGIRAVALFLQTSGLKTGLSHYRLETPVGVKELVIGPDGVITVPLAIARFGRGWSGNSEGHPIHGAGIPGGFRYFEVDVGNPHAVLIVPDAASIDLDAAGSRIEIHSDFPKRTNVEFVGPIPPRGPVPVRVWERGAGATLACGTGACAVAATLFRKGLRKGEVALKLPGGVLSVKEGPDGVLILAGPARRVATGEYLVKS